MQITLSTLTFLFVASSAASLGCQSSVEPTEESATASLVATATVATQVPEEPAAPTAAPEAQEPETEATVPSERAAATHAAKPTRKTEEPSPAAPKAEPTSKSEPAAKPAVAAEPAAAAPAPVIDKPCLAKSFKFASVKSACEKGGVPRAKSLMKGWTDKAKAKGESYKCASCHDNQRTYTNKPNADADLRKLLDLIK